jgi:two-component system sensor histidine kinase UhpB
MRLIQQLNSAVEEERKTIAREIHDHLNAELVEAQRILTLTENNSSNGSIEEINKRARAVIALTSNLYKIAREIIRKLRPEIIDALALCGAVEEMIRHYDTLHPGCRFSFEHRGDFSNLSDDLSITVYRLIQEALSNIVKQSGATTALVTLHSLVEDHRHLKLSVSDDGIGFDVNTTEPGIGLIGMRERVLGLGGQLTIRTAPGTGTVITIEVPVCPDQP